MGQRPGAHWWQIIHPKSHFMTPNWRCSMPLRTQTNNWSKPAKSQILFLKKIPLQDLFRWTLGPAEMPGFHVITGSSPSRKKRPLFCLVACTLKSLLLTEVKGGLSWKKNPCCSMQRNEKKEICIGKNMEWESPYIPNIVMGLAYTSGQCLLDTMKIPYEYRKLILIIRNC